MNTSFRCLLCGVTSSAEGKRSWLTIALSIVSFTWVFDIWYRYCPQCMAKINAVTMVLAVLVALITIGIVAYQYSR
jgi:hypothetical protein